MRRHPSMVPDAVAPPPRHPRFPLLDGMRAIAVLSVLGVHSALTGGALSTSLPGRLLAHLNIGVTIFFLISGFLLYRPMIAHRLGGAPAPSVGDYAKRRVLRIYPAYWVLLTILIVVPGVTGEVGGNWWPMYALVHTLPVYHGARCSDLVFKCGLAQTWSLVVEATFYVALPLYALVVDCATRRLSSRRWLQVQLLLLTALSALSLVLQFALLDPAPTWVTGSVIGYLFWFSLGMGMAVCSVWTGVQKHPLSHRRPTAEMAWAAAFALYLALSLWLPANPFLFVRHEQLVAQLGYGVVAALLLMPSVFGSTAVGLPRRLLAHPIMAWLGLISYGIFLWHYAVVLKLGSPGAGGSFFVVLLGSLGISIPCAAASYYLIERPLLRLKYHRLRDYVRVPTATLRATHTQAPTQASPRRREEADS